MKQLFTLLIISCVSVSVCAQDTTKPEMAKVYVMRATGFAGSAINFRVVVDDDISCKIKNDRYAVFTLRPGKHSFYVTSWDAPKTKEKLGLEIPIEAGKTYYLNMILKKRFMGIEMYFEEITKNAATPLLEKLKEDPDCAK